MDNVMDYCKICGGEATQRIEWIDGHVGGYGMKRWQDLCDLHLMELVRTTTTRYEIKPLKNPRKVTKLEGQQCLDV